MTYLKKYLDVLSENSILCECCADERLPIEYVSCDSQDVAENTLFICKGAHFKEQYLLDALKKGAVCYISEKKYGTDVPCVIVSDIRRAMWLTADLFYEKSWQKLNLVGITGTKGKSTTAYFIKYILDGYLNDNGGKESAIVSSIDTYDGVVRCESHLTTPEPLELHRHFYNAQKSGIDYFTMEVSSQALKYGRTAGVEFTVGCYLNIGIDHISAVEHPDFEDYFQSKMKIFSQCRTAVVNLDSDRADEVMEYAKNAPRTVTFSTKNSEADVYGYNIRKDGSDTVFTVRTDAFERDFTLTVPGLFNVENALCAIAVCRIFGIDEKYIYSGLVKARADGRMEIHESADKKIAVIVDYAHNKMSFESLFASVRREYPGRKVSIVFGCPGSKALIRRRDLGEISGKNADMSYITEDDPAEEPLEDICREIAGYVEGVGGRCKIIYDRGEAIRQAIGECDGEGVVLLAGKGNETHQKRGLLFADYPTDTYYAVKYLKEYDKGIVK